MTTAEMATPLLQKTAKDDDHTDHRIGRKRPATGLTRLGAYVSVYKPNPQPMLITSVLTLEKNPGITELRRTLYERFTQMPRFRSKLVFKGKVHFEECEVDVGYHFEVYGFGRQVSESEVFDVVSQTKERSLDHTKPLWRVIHVPEMEDGTSKLIVVISHVIGDGIGLVNALLFKLIDEAEELSEKHDKAMVNRRSSKPKLPAATAAKVAIYGVLEGYTGPFWVRDRKNPLKLVGKCGPIKHTAAANRKIELSRIKAICQKIGNGVSVNDVLMAAFSKSLGLYFRDVIHEDPDKIKKRKMRASIPVNLRKSGETFDKCGDPDNKFALPFFPVPLSKFDLNTELVLESKRLVDCIKCSPGPVIAVKTADRVLPVVRKSLAISTARRLQSIPTCVVSNVPGPQTQVHLAGAPVMDFQFFLFAPIGIYFGIFSYNGYVAVTVNMDSKIGDNPDALVSLFPTAFDELYSAVCGETKADA